MRIEEKIRRGCKLSYYKIGIVQYIPTIETKENTQDVALLIDPLATLYLALAFV
jgi:hypothetical protein